MQDPEDDGPVTQRCRDTIRVCEACQGSDCPWCSRGQQDRGEFQRWLTFRRNMRTLSNTYSFLEEIVSDILARLLEDGSPEAIDLMVEGRALLDTWLSADDRSESTEALKAFSKRALDWLQLQFRR